MTEHYFSASPQTAAKLREIKVQLGGQERTVTTGAGVFSGDDVDRGTRVLLNTTAPVPAGNILDLGCGWGAISLDSALQAPDATVWALDVNTRALELTASNAAALGLRNVRAVTAAEIPAELCFEQIRSNPPIRVGKAVLHDLMHTWLPRLVRGGSCEMVVAKNLGAASFEKWLVENFEATHEVTRIARDKGFHVIAVMKR